MANGNSGGVRPRRDGHRNGIGDDRRETVWHKTRPQAMHPEFRWLPLRRCHKPPQVVLVCGIGSSVFGWTARFLAWTASLITHRNRPFHSVTPCVGTQTGPASLGPRSTAQTPHTMSSLTMGGSDILDRIGACVCCDGNRDVEVCESAPDGAQSARSDASTAPAPSAADASPPNSDAAS